MRRAVYTVLVGDFDTLLPPARLEPGLAYIAFTDSQRSLPAPWQAQPLATVQRNPRMTSRWHKLHPHLLLPQHDQSLYIDANILIRDSLLPLFELALADAPLALFRHPTRACVYDEAEAVKRLRYDDAAIVDAQMAFYRAQGLPPGEGLHFAGILFRRHDDPKLLAMQENWWRQLKIFSHRDQLSLSFMLRRHGLRAADLPGAVTGNTWFVIGPHRRYRVDLAAQLPPVAGDEIDWLRSSFVAARQAGRGPRRISRRLTDGAVRIVKAPRSMLVRAIRRVAFRRYLKRHRHVPPDSA